ncbi:MAG: hypothetical protein HY272_01930 [Gammaproteobacteria bacterium]|nr:hypothetical protein [Gammaproteobacteria bacterium]
MTQKRYEALTPINHDGEGYAIGADIELDGKHADSLLAVNAIKPKEAAADNAGSDTSGKVVQLKTKTTESADEPTTPIGRQAEIVKAIAKLDADSMAHWTKDKKPDVSALNEILGWAVKVTAAERDAAWAMLQPKDSA